MSTRTGDRTDQEAPRRARLERPTAMQLAREEYTRFADAFADLEESDGNRPTPCSDWDVRQLGAHVAGMAAMAARLREQRRQMRAAGRAVELSGRLFIDELTALQVRERADTSMPELVAELRDLGPRAARARRRTPRLVRRMRLPQAQVVDGVEEWWSIGYLVDVILTRDPWMHRMDLAEATGRPAHLTADHDGVLVADVVAEWAGRHGQPYALVLTGPAGGEFSSGDDVEPLQMEAVRFCETVSGRRPGSGLLSTQVPF